MDEGHPGGTRTRRLTSSDLLSNWTNFVLDD